MLVLWPLIGLLPEKVDEVWLPWLGWLLASLAVLLGWFFYLLFERPLLRRGRRWASLFSVLTQPAGTVLK